MEWTPELTGCKCLVCLTSSLQGAFGIQSNYSVDLRIELVDLAEMGLNHFDRTQLLLPNLASHFGSCQRDNVATQFDLDARGSLVILRRGVFSRDQGKIGLMSIATKAAKTMTRLTRIPKIHLRAFIAKDSAIG